MLREIKKYIGFTENSIKEEYAYKFRSFIWTIYDFVMLFIQYYLWKAIFEANDGVLYNITVDRYISYIIVAMLIGRLTNCFIDGIIAGEVKSGNIAMNLLKPYCYLKMNFARHIGFSIGGLISFLPLLLVSLFLIEFEMMSFYKTLIFIVSIAFAYGLIFLFNLILGIIAFWVTNSWGLYLLKVHVATLFSGQVIALNMLFTLGREGISNVPIPFVTSNFIENFFLGLAYLSYLLPFQAMSYTPTGIYTGMIEGNRAIFMHLLLQFFWLIAFSVLVKFIWNKAQNKVTILGG